MTFIPKAILKRKPSHGWASVVHKDVLAISADFVRVDEKSATFCISSGNMDRDGDILEVAGVDLKNYTANPVWLAIHDDKKFPIGRAKDASGMLRVWADAGKLYATCFFDSGDPLALEVHRKLKEGFLNGASVGFRPKSEPEKIKNGRYRFKEWELLEISIVTLPSNPDATVIEVKSLDKGWQKGGPATRGQPNNAGQFGPGAPKKKPDKDDEELDDAPEKPVGANAPKGEEEEGAAVKPAAEFENEPIVDDPRTLEDESAKSEDETDEVKEEITEIEFDNDDVQCVVLLRAGFPERKDAEEWLIAHNFDPEKLAETPEVWSAEQWPADEMKEGTQAKVNLEDGVIGTKAERKDNKNELEVGEGETKKPEEPLSKEEDKEGEQKPETDESVEGKEKPEAKDGDNSESDADDDSDDAKKKKEKADEMKAIEEVAVLKKQLEELTKTVALLKKEAEPEKPAMKPGAAYYDGCMQRMADLLSHHDSITESVEHPGVTKTCQRLKASLEKDMDVLRKAGKQHYPDVFGEYDGEPDGEPPAEPEQSAEVKAQMVSLSKQLDMVKASMVETRKSLYSATGM